MMYSAYKLNMQGDNTQPWRTPFPIWNQSVVYSAIKKHIWISSNEVDETGAYLQSEVSQKEKHQYSILTHIYEI